MVLIFFYKHDNKTIKCLNMCSFKCYWFPYFGRVGPSHPMSKLSTSLNLSQPFLSTAPVWAAVPPMTAPTSVIRCVTKYASWYSAVITIHLDYAARVAWIHYLNALLPNHSPNTQLKMTFVTLCLWYKHRNSKCEQSTWDVSTVLWIPQTNIGFHAISICILSLVINVIPNVSNSHRLMIK